MVKETCCNAKEDAGVSGLTKAEKEMLQLINQERTHSGLHPLQLDMRLVQAARAKSRDMIANNYFAHTSPTYGSPFEQLRAAGISDYKLLGGENIAGNHSVQDAHYSLMQSFQHRSNILDPFYTHIGIGIVEGGPYGMMITQLFTGK